MKTMLLFAILFLASAFSAFAQSSETATKIWNITELVAFQKSESQALRTKQESEFRLLIDAQKAQMEKMLGNGGNANDLSKLFADERSTIQKQYSEERSKLAELQKAERAELLAAKPKSP